MLKKCIAKIQMESTNEVSESIIEIENEETININSIENRVYNFKIKNYNKEERINGIDIEYYLEFIIIDGIKIKVYKNNEEMKLHNSKTEKFL